MDFVLVLKYQNEYLYLLNNQMNDQVAAVCFKLDNFVLFCFVHLCAILGLTMGSIDNAVLRNVQHQISMPDSVAGHMDSSWVSSNCLFYLILYLRLSICVCLCS